METEGEVKVEAVRDNDCVGRDQRKGVNRVRRTNTTTAMNQVQRVKRELRMCIKREE